MFHRTTILVLLLVTMLGTSWGETPSFLFPANARFILPASKGPLLLQQCSRTTPKPVTGFWEPSPKEIQRLEERLMRDLADRERSRAPLPPKDVPYHRQYVGFVKGGRTPDLREFLPGWCIASSGID